MSSISFNIQMKLNRKLYTKSDHPLTIIKNHIYDFFNKERDYEIFEDMSPHVSVLEEFEDLLIPYNHRCRSEQYAYYINEEIILRTHISAHQAKLMKMGHRKFIVTGDVFRKGRIDENHNNVFHQIEIVNIMKLIRPEKYLKDTFIKLVKYLFPNRQYRIKNDRYLSNPSFKVEINLNDVWVEILSSNIINRTILNNCGITNNGVAIRMGLERLAMIIFGIPNIRYFWVEDARFLSQFKNIKSKYTKPFAYTPISKEISFWLPFNEVNVTENRFEWKNIGNFYDNIAELGNDLISRVDLLDISFHYLEKYYSITFKFIIESLLYEIDPYKHKETINIVIDDIYNYLAIMNYELK